MTRSRRARSIALLAAPLALVAASCGGDDAPAPATVPATVAPVDTTAATTAAPADTTAATTVAPADTTAATTAAPADTTAATTAAPADTVAVPDDTTGENAAPAADLPVYQTLAVTDVDGATFTLADFAGTPVFVEAFATWCPNCREQLVATNEAAATLGDGAVVLALSVETDLDASDVAAYAADNGFDNVRFAVMSPEMLAALVDEFGNSIANPPSTPKFVIDAAGRAGDLTTGGESADDVVAAVQSAAA